MPESSTEKEPLENLELDSEVDNGAEHHEENQGAENNDAGSPAAQTDDKKPKDIVSAVRAALDKTAVKEQSSGSETDSEGEAKKIADAKAGKAKAEEPLGELTDAELATYKTQTQRRIKDFQRIVSQERTEKETERAEKEKYKGSHDRLANFDKYCEDKGLNTEDVQGLLAIGAAIQENPAEALKMLKAIVEPLETIVGEKLPPDLQKEVIDGKITESRAKEISKLRAGNYVVEYKTKESQKKLETQEIQKLATSAKTAVDVWEAQQLKTDPDYRIKQARVAEAIELAMVKAAQTRTLPKSAEEAVKLCTDVKSRIDKEYATFIPKKKAVESIPPGLGASTGSKPSAPKSFMEAIERAVAGS